MQLDATPGVSRSSQWRISLLGVCWLTLAGCGSSAPFDLVPVHGTVEYIDGTRIDAPYIEVVFYPVGESVAADGTGPRPARAIVNPQTGAFDSATTWTMGDGAVAGEHKLVVIARDQKGQTIPAVATRYSTANSTPLTEDIKPERMPLKIQVEREPKGKR